MIARVNETECVGCGVCVESCEQGALKCDDVAKVDAKLCIGCAACVDECPNGAISVE